MAPSCVSIKRHAQRRWWSVSSGCKPTVLINEVDFDQIGWNYSSEIRSISASLRQHH
jgi:hypothetical protein